MRLDMIFCSQNPIIQSQYKTNLKKENEMMLQDILILNSNEIQSNNNNNNYYYNFTTSYTKYFFIYAMIALENYRE